MEISDIVLTTMKIALILGIAFNLFLLVRSIKSNLKTPEGKETWKQQKKFAYYNGFAGFIANFLDVLGIGSFAIIAALAKLRRSIDDINIPGTLNVGCAIPATVEALLFLNNVQVDLVTLVSMISAAVIGSYVGARIVTRLNRTAIRFAMFLGLLIVGIIMLCKQTGIGPFGLTGTATGLTGIKLAIAVAVCFVLGALMNMGVGLSSPCMALVLMLGMNANVAFPIMCGSCAYLQAFGSVPKFIKENRYDMIAALAITICGVVAVVICYFTVFSFLSNHIYYLIWVIIGVVFLTSLLFLNAFIKDKKSASVKK